MPPALSLTHYEESGCCVEHTQEVSMEADMLIRGGDGRAAPTRME